VALLRVRDLSIRYAPQSETSQNVVRHVTFDLDPGEFVGLVGESGSGKSTLGLALARLTKPPARIVGGSIVFNDVDLAALSASQLRAQRRGGVAMVLQSGMNTLNPVRTIGDHFYDIFAAHGHVDKRHRPDRARELVGKVELPPSILPRYPGELSGGMRQRVSIALALSLEPKLMVFDEPTTALDVLVQRTVMDMIGELQAAEQFTAILISHDLGTVLESTGRVMVMHEGEIIEDASAADLVSRPKTDYSRMLLSHYADPRAEVVEVPGLVAREKSRESVTSIVEREGRRAREAVVLTGVSKIYSRRQRGERSVAAVDNVSFALEPGGSLALVGASGSGKSTIASLVTGILRPTSGSVKFGDRDISRLKSREIKRLHREIQIVFQDPYAALNPVHTVEYTLTRPVVNFGLGSRREARARVLELLESVGLTPVEEFAAKMPHQLSGGQRQRVVIARALASEPQVLVADEPVSMLDVSLRAGVLALLNNLRESWGVSLLYITHDLLSARLITDDIMVLNRGRVVEAGKTASVLRRPQDPYTLQLLAAIPLPSSRNAKDPL
jgi:peptide/nickel transport system ATP-binding protein